MSIDDQLENAARRFRSRFDDMPVPQIPARSGRRGRAVASVVLVVAVIVGVAVVIVASTRTSPERVRVSAPATSTTPPTSAPQPALRDGNLAAGPMLWPMFTPSGEQLSSVSSLEDGGIGMPSQLFGTVAADGTLAPGVLFEFQRTSPGGTVNGTSTARVRGVDAAVSPPKDAAGADLEIMWTEGNTLVNAILRGVSQDQAVAMLDALRPRTTDLLDGFDPASARPGFANLGERLGVAANPSGVQATFEYSSVPTERTADLQVVTQTHSIYPGYLRAWIGGRRGADGVVVAPDAFDVYHLLTLAWPDGREVTMQSTRADAATLERIGRSIELTTVDEGQTRLRVQSAQLNSLPMVGTVSLPDATVELHSDGGTTAICVRVEHLAALCRSDVVIQPTADYIIGSFLLDSKWFAIAAAPGYEPLVGPPVNLGAPRAANFPAQTATIGNWHIALVPVPASVAKVQVIIPTSPGQSAGATLTRPRVP
jgi:hypothetical protein